VGLKTSVGVITGVEVAIGVEVTGATVVWLAWEQAARMELIMSSSAAVVVFVFFMFGLFDGIL